MFSLLRSPVRVKANRRADPRRFVYGCYFVADGSVVLFNRRYQPMFRLDRHGRVSADDPDRWVQGIIGKIWFYSDKCSPRRNQETRRRVGILLRRWQAAAGGMHVPIGELLPAEWIFNRKPPLAA